MRILIDEQKKILDKFVKDNTLPKAQQSNGYCFKNGWTDLSIDELSYELFAQIKELNDHETLRQNINQYLSDKTDKIIFA